MKERILKIMEREKMNPSRFAEEIGIQRSALSHILNDRNKVSLEVVMKILGRFDYLNTDWLLFGKGAMTASDRATFQPELFDKEEIFAYERPAESKYDKEEKIKKAPQVKEPTDKEIVIIKETPLRSVSKILLFYTDNTFDTFIPEK